MANQSIRAAFDRMWQHVVAKLGDKANVDHNHNDMYYTESEVDSKISAVNTNITNITNGSVIVKEAEHATNADIATTANTAISATKATQDGNGKVISSTYETKVDAQTKLDEAKAYADSASTTAATKVKNDLLNGAGGAYDTLKELGDLIDTNVDAIEALETVASGKADKVHGHAISDVNGLQDSLDEISEKANESATFIVTITDNGDGTYSSDKTFAEIIEAYESGKIVKCTPYNISDNFIDLAEIAETYVAFELKSFDGKYQWFTIVQIIAENGQEMVLYDEIEVNIFTDAEENSLATTDKTIVGAINEVHSELDSHNHDDAYYTQTQVDTKLSGKANTSHKHVISDVTNLQSALDGKADASHGTHVTFDSTNKPKMDGTSAFGTSTKVARADHVHPTDTSRASKTEFDSHVSDSTKHITSTERTNWGTAYSHSQTAHAPSNAQANVIESIKVNGTAQTISSKSVNITVPKTASDIGAAESSHKHAISDINNLQTTLNNASSAIGANTSSISAHTDRISALETKVGDGFEEITSAEIQALFA